MLPSEQTNVSLPGSPVRAKNRKEQFFVSIAGFVLAPHEFHLFPTWTARPGADGRPCYPERAQVLDAARLYLSGAYMPALAVVRKARGQGWAWLDGDPFFFWQPWAEIAADEPWNHLRLHFDIREEELTANRQLYIDASKGA